MLDLEIIKQQIKWHGNVVEDSNLNRDVHEIIGFEHRLNSKMILHLLENVPLNPKYDLELHNIKEWFDSHYPLYNYGIHRRHQVYFNDIDYDNIHQCISLFQVIDSVMIVYQRSSDTSKLQDDLRFFAEITKRFYNNKIKNIIIFYGSIHTQV